jgi:hypothetical protein
MIVVDEGSTDRVTVGVGGGGGGGGGVGVGPEESPPLHAAITAAMITSRK